MFPQIGENKRVSLDGSDISSGTTASIVQRMKNISGFFQSTSQGSHLISNKVLNVSPATVTTMKEQQVQLSSTVSEQSSTCSIRRKKSSSSHRGVHNVGLKEPSIRKLESCGGIPHTSSSRDLLTNTQEISFRRGSPNETSCRRSAVIHEQPVAGGVQRKPSCRDLLPYDQPDFGTDTQLFHHRSMSPDCISAAGISSPVFHRINYSEEIPLSATASDSNKSALQLFSELDCIGHRTTDDDHVIYEYREIENNQEAIDQLESTGESIEQLLEILHVKRSEKASIYAAQVMKARKIYENFCSGGQKGLTYSNFCVLADSFHHGHMNEIQSRGLFAYLDQDDEGLVLWKVIQTELLEFEPKDKGSEVDDANIEAVRAEVV